MESIELLDTVFISSDITQRQNYWIQISEIFKMSPKSQFYVKYLTFKCWQIKKKILFLLNSEANKRVSLVAQMVKNLPAVQQTPVWSLGWENTLEKGMATHPMGEFRGRGAWRSTVHRVMGSWTWWATNTSTFHFFTRQTKHTHLVNLGHDCIMAFFFFFLMLCMWTAGREGRKVSIIDSDCRCSLFWSQKVWAELRRSTGGFQAALVWAIWGLPSFCRSAWNEGYFLMVTGWPPRTHSLYAPVLGSVH